MGNAVESRVAHRNDMAFDYVRWTHTEKYRERTGADLPLDSPMLVGANFRT